jgi:transcriptional regulator GlxA family with amidase domain
MTRHQVTVVALDHTVALDLGVPAQIFGAARDQSGRSRYTVRTCTLDGGPVTTSSDFSVTPEHGPEIIAEADTVIIPGVSHRSPYLTGPTPSDAKVIRSALAEMRPGARLVSICTGAFVLAAAGALAGRRATTHWFHAERFRTLYPNVDLNPDVLFVDDGDVLTSAGVAAGIDLCLHIVRRDQGPEIANRAARRSVVPAWRDGGQAQFIERPLPAVDQVGTGAARAWALQRLAEPLDLAGWARQAQMSVRTFTRRFREENGVSPAQWLTTQRVEQARRLLETTALSVDQVAAQAGFGTSASLRQHLRASVGVAPLTYRRAFR